MCLCQGDALLDHRKCPAVCAIVEQPWGHLKSGTDLSPGVLNLHTESESRPPGLDSFAELTVVDAGLSDDIQATYFHGPVAQRHVTCSRLLSMGDAFLTFPQR